jgi:hypothetical protein
MNASLRVVTIFTVLLSTSGYAGGTQPNPQWTAADIEQETVQKSNPGRIETRK